ncbi:MAG TPA: lipoate--protein ligase family protein [Longimicrobiales bacterium]|nr:lipoate--protein ligase family protein [Longimicrobiales bacterium]
MREPPIWRLVDSEGPPRTGADNMARDQALLESVQAGGHPALRLYAWDPPCLSFGRNQPARGIYDPAAAAARGIDVVRRPTGGRAVLHDREVTYAVAVPVGTLGSPRETYVAINRALVAGLRALGVAARVAGATELPLASEPGGRAAAGSGTGSRGAGAALGPAPCFEAAAPGEVVAGGLKLVGSAQRCERRVLLQHGSLLLDGDQSVILSLLAAPDGPTLSALPRPGAASPPGAATLAALLGCAPLRGVVEAALVGGFEEALGIRLARVALSPDEERAAARWQRHFGSAAWTWRR